jgi:dihydroorotate dehydrogenase
MDWYYLAKKWLFLLDAELSHNLALFVIKNSPEKIWRLLSDFQSNDQRLSQRLWGIDFPHPLGLAAGFDKNAALLAPLLAMGFGFVEAGSVTPRPQQGNPKPRLFREIKAEAIINRMGFNNEGLEVFANRLAAFAHRFPLKARLIGANLGKNRDTDNASSDYILGLKATAPYAGYVVINVSSPNTPALRNLQQEQALEVLLSSLKQARDEGVHKPPLLVKVAPDLTKEEVASIAKVVLRTAIDGIIVGNTTLSRPASLAPAFQAETGGLSGQPLFALSTEVLAEFYRHCGNSVPIIGVGGIDDGDKAYEKICQGASLLQLYTGFVFKGPNLINTIKHRLSERLAQDKLPHISAAIGSAHKRNL